MSLMNRILYRLSAHLRCRVIRGNRDEPYLERYHLLRLPLGIHFYLHRFVASDPGRALHNHPWRGALSIVLSGGYEETRLGAARDNYALRKRHVSAGQFNYISGRVYHRINLKPGQQAWTLFIHSGRHRSWGFLDTAQRRFRYVDHNEVIAGAGNPRWWKTALRPIQNPGVRAAPGPLWQK